MMAFNHDEIDVRDYATRIDLAPEVQVEMVEILNRTLASTIDLQMQFKCSHWNVKGMQFFQLHHLFDSLAEQLGEVSDLLAERVTALGGVALGTVQIASQASQIHPYPDSLTTGQAHLIAMAERTALYGKLVRHSIELADGLGDAGSADLYTEISRSVDKSLWLLEAHLQG